MNDPREDKSYMAHLSLSIKFGDIEFKSEVKNYSFEVAGGYTYTEEELDDIAKSCFISEHEDIFMDMDSEITVVNIRKC